MTELPTDLRYSTEHEWVRADNEMIARIGVTSYATQALGDIVYVSLPTAGSTVAAGDACGELESTKSVSDVFSPVSGVITATNDAVAENPELINQSPFEDGWLFEVELSQAGELSQLLDADEYGQHIAAL